jgi:hypothetical protein
MAAAKGFLEKSIPVSLVQSAKWRLLYRFRAHYCALSKIGPGYSILPFSSVTMTIVHLQGLEGQLDRKSRRLLDAFIMPESRNSVTEGR